MTGRHTACADKPAKVKFSFPDDAQDDFNRLRDEPCRKGGHQNLVPENINKYLFHYSAEEAGLTSTWILPR